MLAFLFNRGAELVAGFGEDHLARIECLEITVRRGIAEDRFQF